MKRILYVGNNLKNNKSNISGIQILGALLEKEGYRIHYTSSKTNKISRLLDMVRSCVALSKNIDCVLIDTYSTQNFYFALIISQLCSLLKIKYIPILHGGNLPSRLKNSPKLSELIFKNAAYNVSPSAYLKQEFELFGYKNVVHIPNVIEIKDYPILKKDFDTPKLLWVRSFSKIYNPQLAIQVFNDIKKSYPKAKLCMVGPDADGTLEDVKMLATQLNLNVEFTGKLTKKEWISVSKNYNIFINTTNLDNTPVSVIEAMALGLPVVSTNVGGMPFLISDTIEGLLVQPQDSKAMVNKILELMLDVQLREKLVYNAREKSESFAWEAVKSRWDSILS
ncbi:MULTISPECIES: glycosyltransferase family 4 protein [Winogradskyella]|uniref:glycosyltransferase family 4 protein n=1 Tax=Winogradskyella TaxID=286104 RepID=UPI0015C8BCE4|nr:MULTISPECIES: glycosyltransferase family 4 protein [Winogradskyella]QXP78228.1 glycosyltransferase family 4 protein [Winogradskyella sp. HaHa_3_26]